MVFIDVPKIIKGFLTMLVVTNIGACGAVCLENKLKRFSPQEAIVANSKYAFRGFTDIGFNVGQEICYDGEGLDPSKKDKKNLRAGLCYNYWAREATDYLKRLQDN